MDESEQARHGNGALARAREALAAGDAEALDALLEREPELVRARWPGAQAPYDGYFHRATLLHHVGGNPLVVPVPANAVRLAAILLERGAEVDASTAAGPSQPDDIGWTTLGLVATSAEARAAGVQQALLELLFEHGADLDARGGGALMGALYYGEEAAAHWLAAQGADVDLVASAGLGRLDLMEGFVRSDGLLAPDAHHLVHYSREPAPAHESRADVLGLALCYAVKLGRLDAAGRLVELGASVDARPFHDHRATPLHWAVIGDRPRAVEWLLAHGADPGVRDATHGATPAEWARHQGRTELERLLG